MSVFEYVSIVSIVTLACYAIFYTFLNSKYAVVPLIWIKTLFESEHVVPATCIVSPDGFRNFGVVGTAAFDLAWETYSSEFPDEAKTLKKPTLRFVSKYAAIAHLGQPFTVLALYSRYPRPHVVLVWSMLQARDFKSLVQLVLHELVHHSQHARGLLEMQTPFAKTWRGVPTTLYSRLVYSQLPWEVEAESVSRELVELAFTKYKDRSKHEPDQTFDFGF